MTARSNDTPWAERTMIQVAPGPIGPARAGQWAHFLVCQEQPDADTPTPRVRLSGLPVRIGRREPCELLLPDTDVSGLHCEVRLEDGEVLVTDLGSTNGSFVDGVRVAGQARLHNGGSLQVGRRVVRLEVRELHELARAEELSRDLERANHYVRSMLPPPWDDGALRIEWCFHPSTKVGGDGFGYFALDAHRRAVYIIDVAGHGVGAALHLVTVMNVLRQRALPHADLAQPAEVLAALNDMFQMDRHDGMLFSCWYGVFDERDHNLVFACAGHHPACLLPADEGPLQLLHTRKPPIGALPAAAFPAAEVQLKPADRLYLFSDGVFEISAADGSPWGFADFAALLGRQPALAGVSEPDCLYKSVREVAQPGPLDDDFSLLLVTVLR